MPKPCSETHDDGCEFFRSAFLAPITLVRRKWFPLVALTNYASANATDELSIIASPYISMRGQSEDAFSSTQH